MFSVGYIVVEHMWSMCSGIDFDVNLMVAICCYKLFWVPHFKYWNNWMNFALFPLYGCPLRSSILEKNVEPLHKNYCLLRVPKGKFHPLFDFIVVKIKFFLHSVNPVIKRL